LLNISYEVLISQALKLPELVEFNDTSHISGNILVLTKVWLTSPSTSPSDPIIGTTEDILTADLAVDLTADLTG
jgi:hypothetical protein